LIKRLKKRLAKAKVPLEKLLDVLGEEPLGVLDVEAELEFEVEQNQREME